MAQKPDAITNPLTNKGTAFTHEERAKVGLTGRLPAAVETLDQQAVRSYAQLRDFPTDLDRTCSWTNSTIATKSSITRC